MKLRSTYRFTRPGVLIVADHGSDSGPSLVELNQEALTLSRQLTDLSTRAQAFESGPVAGRDVWEVVQSVETFWEDLFPREGNRLIRLLVEKVKVRETGIEMELETQGLTGLIIELRVLASENPLSASSSGRLSSLPA